MIILLGREGHEPHYRSGETESDTLGPEKLRIGWRRKRRNRYAKVGFRDYDQGQERLASTTTRPCMCSLAFSKAFEQKLKRLLAAVKPKASRTSSGGTVSGTHIVSSISTFQTASGLQGSHRHRIFY
ncbi:hypothetical protein BDV18DRAFT_139773 [Aspergillus unguis]